MQNYQELILKELLKLHNTKSYMEIIEQFGKKQIIDQKQFISMMKILNDQIPKNEIENFYLSTLIKLGASSISSQLLKVIHTQTNEIFPELNVSNRSSNEMFFQISKTIKENKEDLQQVFIKFDIDKDNILNEIEFKQLLEYYLPKMCQDEYIILKNTIQDNELTLKTLKKYLYEDNFIEQQRRQKNQHTQPNNFLNIQMSPQQDNKSNVEICQQDLQNEKLDKKQSQISQSPLQNYTSKVSNAYEDSTQESILATQIKFKNFSIIDYNISNIYSFLEQFNDKIQQNGTFTDKDFPANKNSLGSKLEGFQWQRLKDIWPDYEVFVQNRTQSRFGLGKWISPKDICQGQLGDCYFLSVLSSLASRWPDFLLSLFITQKKNPWGIYSVRLCIDGIWKAIILDDFVPTLGNEPAFSSSLQKEIWVILLEKAWAKSFGSYSNIISGHSKEVMHSLTGGPTWSLKTDQADFKEQFSKCVQKKCLMTTGTFSKTTDKDMKGLIYDHAYAILKIKVILHPEKGKVTLIKLRNPWGKKEWMGEWNDDSPLWTNEIKQQLKISQKAQDGVFYMSYEDFILYFNTIYVGYFQKQYYYKSSIESSKSNRSIYFVFNNDKAGQYYFTAQQQSSRHFKDTNINYQYSSIRMILAQQTDKGYVLKQAKYEQDQSVFLGEDFEIKWLDQLEGKFVISAYGPEEVKLKKIEKDPTFLKTILMNLSKQNPIKEQHKCRNLEINSQFLTYGIGYEYYKNTGNNQIEIQCVYSKMVGLKLKKPERGNSYSITLQPNCEYLIMYSIQVEGYDAEKSNQYSTTIY